VRGTSILGVTACQSVRKCDDVCISLFAIVVVVIFHEEGRAVLGSELRRKEKKKTPKAKATLTAL
jgi:hypothetical protein